MKVDISVPFDKQIHIYYVPHKISKNLTCSSSSYQKNNNISCENQILLIKKNYSKVPYKIFSSPGTRMRKNNPHCSMENYNPNVSNISSKAFDNKSTLDNVSNPNASPYSEKLLSSDEVRNIMSALDNYFLFNDMPKQIIELLMIELQQFSFDKGSVIYNEGEQGSLFFIVAKGELVSFVKNKEKKRYYQWECFGGLCMINSDMKRDETVKAITSVDLLCMTKDLYSKIKQKIVDEKYKDRFRFINTISFLKNLDVITKYNLSDKLTTKQFKKDEVIMKKGENSDSMYFIKDGLVSCRLDGKEIRTLANQNCFGECGLLLNDKRTLDIVALEKTICYIISKEMLIQVLGNTFIEIILFSIFRVNIVKNVFFKDIIIDSLLLELFQCFKLKKYVNKEVIFYQNKDNENAQKNDKILLIIEGSLYYEGNKLPFAGKGSVVGEDILFKDSITLKKNIIAMPDCIALESSSEPIRKILGIEKNKAEGKQFNLYKRISKLKKLNLFKNLSDGILQSIAIGMQKKKYNENDIIVKEGDIGDSLFLINKGRVSISKNGIFLRYLEMGDCFGEITVLSKKKEKRTATVTANSDNVICYVLSKKDVDRILINNTEIKKYLLKKIALTDISIQLKDLYFYKFLGKGKFGSVNLVHNKKNIYAIKCVSRLKVNKEKILGKYLLNERRIMLSLDHPFILKLVKTFKNKNFCFFLIEYINGINLDEYLNSKEKFKNFEETQFYLAILISVLEYLQNKNIAHRDLKPSNMMIDSNGYLKVIDFGTAKVLDDYTMTVVGTPHYISPEILLGKGYSISCDYWSFGICAYEIFYGYYPFGNYANEVMEIYKEIVNNDYVFPSNKTKYKYINELINALLEKNVSKRCCKAKDLKRFTFFKGYEWDKLNDFSIVPPYIPKIIDLSNVTQMDSNPFEKEIEKEGSEVLDDTTCDAISSSTQYDNNWADEF